MSARHLMRREATFIEPDLSVEDAWQLTATQGAPAYLVGTRERLLGSITRGQLDDLRTAGRAGEPLHVVVTDAFVHAHPDHPLDVVLERLAESDGVLPVVSRTEVRRVEGIITRDSILDMGFERRRRRTSIP
jgi:CBS domain-containing protein